MAIYSVNVSTPSAGAGAKSDYIQREGKYEGKKKNYFARKVETCRPGRPQLMIFGIRMKSASGERNTGKSVWPCPMSYPWKSSAR